MDTQASLRDNYVSCTEPVDPYHGNYVIISLSKPYCLHLPLKANHLTLTAGWESIGLYSSGSLSVYPAHWDDPSRNFIMPTHCVRTWSNASYWGNRHSLTPVARAAHYPEPQIGGTMYMYAYLLGMAIGQTLPTSYSQLDYTYATGDSYRAVSEQTRPCYAIQPSEYVFLNNDFVTYTNTPLVRIGGLNLTSYVVSFVYQKTIRMDAPCSSYLQVIIKPLVPYVDLSGCWLNPPANYLSYRYQDWDGYYELESKYGTAYTNGSAGEQLPLLPAIAKSINTDTRCFEVVLPVQLFTLSSVDSAFTFTLQDISHGTPPSGPNMEVVATRVRGTFWDSSASPTNAMNATQVHFEILEPTSVFHLSHAFADNLGNVNRPFYCTESDSLPTDPPTSAITCLLLSPRCGPGVWTNMPQTN